ncbi:MAG: hypothetical protein ACT4PM_05375 [Gemmatimonadales bacterium]
MSLTRVWLVGMLVTPGLTAGSAAAQSQFGMRGLGLPLRPISARATATGGAFAPFDAESALNPASFALLTRVNAGMQIAQVWNSSENPLGTGSTRTTRYPGFFVTTPIGGTRLVIGLSASGYTDRNFAVVSRDSIVLRDVPVEVLDTITSLGGISDLRAAVAWRASARVQTGLGFHILTGSNRISSHRVFSDPLYVGASERNTLSYLGLGISAGVTVRPLAPVVLAGTVRFDDHLRVERDTTSLGNTDLPITLSGGILIRATRRLELGGGAVYRNWSVADSDLVVLGGVGSVNTTEWSLGMEYLTDTTRPGRRPLRLGFHRSQLPFALQRGVGITETGISAGTSTEFAGGRVRLDLTLSRIWRKGGAAFSERATLLSVGIALAPPGLR